MPPRRDGALGDPLEGFFEYLARVRFERCARRAPAARVHLIVEARGKLLPVIVRVQIGAQIDVRARRAHGFRTSSAAGSPVISVAIMNVLSITFRNPSCSKK